MQHRIQEETRALVCMGSETALGTADVVAARRPHEEQPLWGAGRAEDKS
jgi:hypothetical protein